MKQKHIIINNQVISYVLSQNLLKENTLIFLHWWWQDANSFLKIYKILEEKKISFIWIDLPGFWKSELVNENMNIYDYAKIVVDFIEKLEIKNPILIWHSFWWRISIVLWSSYENIKKIVLISSAWIKKDLNTTKLFIVKIWKNFFKIPWLRWIWEKIRKKVWSRDYNNSWVMKKIFLNTINEDLRKNSENVKYKTLIIWWAKDQETPIEDWKFLNKLIKNSKLEIFENWTHFVYREYPKEVTELIIDFIKR